MLQRILIIVALLFLTISFANAQTVKVETPTITSYYGSGNPEFVKSYIESVLSESGWNINQRSSLTIKTDIQIIADQSYQSGSFGISGYNFGNSSTTNNMLGIIVLKVVNNAGNIKPIINFSGVLNPSVINSNNISTPFFSTSSYGNTSNREQALSAGYVFYLVQAAIKKLNDRKNEIPVAQNLPQSGNNFASDGYALSPDVTIHAAKNTRVYLKINFQKEIYGTTDRNGRFIYNNNLKEGTFVSVTVNGCTKSAYTPYTFEFDE